VKRSVRIGSYFCFPVDLAAEMSSWPEFISGKGYSVTLTTNSESVSTSFEYDEEHRYVSVHGEGDGELFLRVLGIVVWALSSASEDVLVTRWSAE